MEEKTLKFVNKSTNPNPSFAHLGDSGFDLRAWITEEDNGYEVNEEGCLFIRLKPFETRKFHTGLYFQLPPHTEIQVRTRSGIALAQQLIVTNTPGTVDEFYTDEVGIIITNLSNKEQIVTNSDRIAQGVLCPVYNNPLTKLVKVESIESNAYRDKKGFGSSGVK